MPKLGPAKTDPETGDYVGKRAVQVRAAIKRVVEATDDEAADAIAEARRLMYGDK